MNLRFCYKIDKKVHMAKDEDGNPTEAYSCVTVKTHTYCLPKEQYKTLNEQFRSIISITSDISKALIVPITLNEYLDNAE